MQKQGLHENSWEGQAYLLRGCARVNIYIFFQYENTARKINSTITLHRALRLGSGADSSQLHVW